MVDFAVQLVDHGVVGFVAQALPDQVPRGWSWAD
jgi:hypothetical protein